MRRSATYFHREFVAGSFDCRRKGGYHQSRMPWVRALLHGQVVYARARPDGSLQLQGNRVEVCYSPNASRLYMARVTNVKKDDAAQVLPDEACTPRADSASRLRKAPSVGGLVTKKRWSRRRCPRRLRIRSSPMPTAPARATPDLP